MPCYRASPLNGNAVRADFVQPWEDEYPLVFSAKKDLSEAEIEWIMSDYGTRLAGQELRAEIAERERMLELMV